MSNEATPKTTQLLNLHLHGDECGDGRCGCGCGDPFVSLRIPQKATASEECCEPVCGPETCG